LSQKALAQVLRRLPRAPRDPNLLVGSLTADDAGVYRLPFAPGTALVQTVDFFTPIVDDPFTYGRIAATNALSDVYAMGGRPLTALALLGVPVETVPDEVIVEILRGGAAVARSARCALLGGHTIRNPEPIYGLAVTGVINPKKVLTNARAQPGDLLVLTKPLGTGIVTTALKRGLCSQALEEKAVRVMMRLNTVGAELAEAGLVRAATDVTGYGLLGHLGSMCGASGAGAEIEAAAVPALSPEIFRLIEQGCVPGGSRQNLETANEWTEWQGVDPGRQALLADAQTSGGLLLCVPPRHRDAVMALLKRRRTICAAEVGRIVRSAKPRILVSSTIERATVVGDNSML
jgi:selenide,water dikinase